MKMKEQSKGIWATDKVWKKHIKGCKRIIDQFWAEVLFGEELARDMYPKLFVKKDE